MTLEEVFADTGPFGDAFPGYKLRQPQLEMALAVERAIASCGQLIAEAGTGTGKTFAYLVPALLSGGKVIVSTGTKTLQDQLFNRDVPSVRDVLKVPVVIALLKGRSNYVCHYHLARAEHEGRFMRREDVADLQKIKRYVNTTNSGDKAACPGVPEDAPIWAHVTSTRDNCLGQDCPNHKDCFVLKARKDAQEADVVVVNHHLFFADVWLKDEGAGELLPACNTVIFDEAHQLPEVASLFFGDTLTSGQVVELARDARAEALVVAKDYVLLPNAAEALEKSAKDVRLVFKDIQRLPQHELKEKFPAFFTQLNVMTGDLQHLAELLAKQAERGESLEKCHQRAAEMLELLEKWQKSDSTETVHWIDVTQHGFLLHITPLNIADLFQKQVNMNPRAWIFASATLAVNNQFTHFQHELGLWKAETATWDSPFDYKQQAVLYVPQDMPQPNTPEYTRTVIEKAWPLLHTTQGHAFLLFTSLRAMREAHELLLEKLKDAGLDWPVYLQGTGSRTELLDQFRKEPNAILVASQTFWEGIDVRGDQLSLVVIDKLPFSPPDDPVLSARMEQITKAGRSPFMDYQLPNATITLKQGAGRLIRDETDIGILMIADTRLVEKQYGKMIWKSLPPMFRSRELANVQKFYEVKRSGRTISEEESKSETSTEKNAE
ncbi:MULTISPECIES: ATP-dependent DNA helicase [Deefgea]|uniref:DNA 5'-3' helicase n=1 Tax=Deefgea chitinilytica TaxID=570276 RepID=A0ABS2C9J8_9NEIS|nr:MULTISPECIES: ATP-dependent DNA helicase [Deefgea]MBM5570809.1 ATP-dependent DNA helicase [Deefgea chitinilytica]MBM9888038.1 ATP-dependent DNA helicase [Deefgea sp. CFH1-16]